MPRRTVIIVSVLLAVVFGGGTAVVVAHPLLERHKVPSESMVPTVEIGDVVHVNRGVYRDEPPAVGDVVIFHPPQGAVEANECGAPHPHRQVCAQPTPKRAAEQLIKRVVAGPGDRIVVRHGHVILNGERQKEPYTAQRDDSSTHECDVPELCDFRNEITIAAGHYFLMGDNRAASDDSRHWGPVPRGWILGRVERCRAIIFACSRQR